MQKKLGLDKFLFLHKLVYFSSVDLFLLSYEWDRKSIRTRLLSSLSTITIRPEKESICDLYANNVSALWKVVVEEVYGGADQRLALMVVMPRNH